MDIERIVNTLASKIVNPLAQNTSHHSSRKVITPGMPEALRSAAAQGAVLLENKVLPLKLGTRVSIFGRVQCNYFYTGYGSGGDVNTPYTVSLLEGMRNCSRLSVNEVLAKEYESWCQDHPIADSVWGMWPRFYEEMPLSVAQVSAARGRSDQAVIVLGRSSGEDRENVLEPGSFLLTDQEKTMLRQVTSIFPNAILVLNIGSVMDLSFLKDYPFGAVLLAWQGGMESGNAVADLLCGSQTPSGRLTDTIACKYDDYPSAAHFGDPTANEYFEDIYVGYRYFETFSKEKVLYPFGYGLSYTTFRKEVLSGDGRGETTVRITNTGRKPGRETALLYVSKPCGKLGKPARELIAFAKSRSLEPGESQELTLSVSEAQLASYDDSGITGHKNAWVMEPGEYRFFLGGDVRSAEMIGSFTLEETRVIRQLREAAAPQKPFPILAAGMEDGAYVPKTIQAPARTRDLKADILKNLPKERLITGDRGHKLKDVQQGKISLDTFVAQLNLQELEAISRGGYVMGNSLGPRGNAGVFGGVTDSLRKKGIPPVTTTDGPSGIRLYDSCSLMPIGTLLACSFDTALVESLMARVGQEMRQRRSDVLLGPGMNIHRNPLCGRNFEYFSEDPLLTGKIAAAVVRGIQSAGVSACPKHFACNNQETKRNTINSVVSQRALREIYLMGFEICVKESAPKNIMTSYNKVNSVWAHYHYELVTDILRGEWGYQGNVMTDWWMQYAPSPEFPRLSGNGYRVRAGVDLLMPGSRSFLDKRRRPDGTLLATYKKPDGITLGEMQASAKHILLCILNIKEL